MAAFEVSKPTISKLEFEVSDLHLIGKFEDLPTFPFQHLLILLSNSFYLGGIAFEDLLLLAGLIS